MQRLILPRLCEMSVGLFVTRLASRRVAMGPTATDRHTLRFPKGAVSKGAKAGAARTTSSFVRAMTAGAARRRRRSPSVPYSRGGGDGGGGGKVVTKYNLAWVVNLAMGCVRSPLPRISFQRPHIHMLLLPDTYKTLFFHKPCTARPVCTQVT